MKQKLQSRKFWAAVFAVGSALVFVLTGNELDQGATNQLAELVPSLIALGYVLVEGVVDAFGARANAQANLAAHQMALTEAKRMIEELTGSDNG